MPTRTSGSASQTLSRDAVSPLTRVEHVLLPWTSFVILPLFALANVGVELSASTLAAAAGEHGRVGHPARADRSARSWGSGRVPSWPRGSGSPISRPACDRPISSGGGRGRGIGFTVSLFIAELAFGRTARCSPHVKIGILAASVVAGILGWTVLRLSPAAGEDDASRGSRTGTASETPPETPSGH